MVNGPEDEVLDWHNIDWCRVEEDVRRLGQRIFTASQAGDLAKVRNLQKLMLRSRANTLVSVRRVTEINAGRETAGVDGKVVLLPQAKVELAAWVQKRGMSWTPKPVKRVYIPKPGGKQRPLGIPVIADVSCRHGWSTRWNPSGSPGSSPVPMSSGRVVAVRTRSQPSI